MCPEVVLWVVAPHDEILGARGEHRLPLRGEEHIPGVYLNLSL